MKAKLRQFNRDENNKLCGDLDVEDVKTKISAYSPVPGGVGIMTVLALMENVIKSIPRGVQGLTRSGGHAS